VAADAAPNPEQADRVEGSAGTTASWMRALLIAAAAIGMLVLALVVGGGRPQPVPAGLPDPGPLTGWGVPVARLGLALAAAATVGSVLVGLLSPSSKGLLGAPAVRAVRAAGMFAWVWAALAAASLVFTLSDLLGEPVASIDYQSTLASFIAQIAQGRALAVVAVLAVIVAAASRGVETLNGAALLLILALGATIPPALTGHASGAADHDLATSSLIVHVVAVSVWVGGLFALVMYGRRAGKDLRRTAERFSGIALWCFVAAGLSGVLNAYVRLGALGELFGSRYGWLVVGKTAALVALGTFGWWHRRRTLRELAADRPGAFRRWAFGEAAVMAATIGLAAALSRTPTPVPETDLATQDVSRAAALLGWEVPPLTGERLLTLWRPDAIVLTLALLAVAGYVAGLRRLRARGVDWPVGRTVAWLSGVTVAVILLCSGIATYAPAMFSVHMVQHMSLTMLVPILLALGAPLTLALRALPAAPRGGDRNLREWILTLVHSRYVRFVTHPVVALALYIITLYAFYFSGVFAWAMSTHIGHLLMVAHFLAVGIVFFWPIIALDPMPRKLPPVGRMLLLFASIPFHAFFGVIVMTSDVILGEEWFGALRLPWVDLAADQNVAGGIAWGATELPTLAVAVVVFYAWYRSDQRVARRSDRRAEAELESYNAMLARLASERRSR